MPDCHQKGPKMAAKIVLQARRVNIHELWWFMCCRNSSSGTGLRQGVNFSVLNSCLINYPWPWPWPCDSPCCRRTSSHTTYDHWARQTQQAADTGAVTSHTTSSCYCQVQFRIHWHDKQHMIDNCQSVIIVFITLQNIQMTIITVKCQQPPGQGKTRPYVRIQCQQMTNMSKVWLDCLINCVMEAGGNWWHLRKKYVCKCG